MTLTAAVPVPESVVIIGAGMSGVSFGRLLQLSGFTSFTILEAEEEAGGLCRSQVVDGHTLDLAGGHFLCSRFPEVYEFIFRHLPESDFRVLARSSKVKLDGTYIDYPAEFNLWQLPSELRAAYERSLSGVAAARDTREAGNYEEWIRLRLGNRIAEEYMLPYNMKIWGVDPSEMDVDWLHKVPKVDLEAVLESFREERAPPDVMPSHEKFYYPRGGGFQAIFDAIREPVRRHIRAGEQVRSLEQRSDKWVVNGSYEASVVVNTAPWPRLFDALGRPSVLRRSLPRLQSNGIVVSLWTERYEHDWHWVYDPDLRHEYHRKFFIGNFALDSRPDGVYTETNVKRWPGPDRVWSCGKKPLFEHVVETAYPIPVLGHSKAIRSVLDHYRSRCLYGLGRWGQWQYLNADVCILESMKLARSLGFEWV